MQQAKFEPVNDLERSLVRAATDPAHRPSFSRDILDSDIFVIQEKQPSGVQGLREFQAGEEVALQTWEQDGKKLTAIFSSLDRLLDFVQAESGYLQMKARDFMGLTLGTTLLLNPGSEYGKEFLPAEVESMLDGSIWKPQETITFEKETKVFMGQPANYPDELIDALTRYFKTANNVQRAYLAHVYNPERNEKSHTLIAIEVDGEWEQVAGDAGMVVDAVNVPDPPVDFMRVGGKEGNNIQLLESMKLFYDVSAGSESIRHSPWWKFW